MKSTQKERGRLIGLDAGEKYVGLALSDFDNKIASPFRYAFYILTWSLVVGKWIRGEGFFINFSCFA